MITFFRMKMCEIERYITWSQEPDINKWHFNNVSKEDIQQTITRHIVNFKAVHPFTIRFNHNPIGYAQWYWCKDAPKTWDSSYADAISIDLFLSESSINKKIEHTVIQHFCSFILKNNRPNRIIATPTTTNIEAIKAFTHATFHLLQQQKEQSIFEFRSR